MSDEAEPVVARREVPVLRHPGVARHRPALLAQARATRLAALVDAGTKPGAGGAAQLPLMLGFMAVVRKHGADGGRPP